MHIQRLLSAGCSALILAACSGGSATGPELPLGPLVNAKLQCSPLTGSTGTVTARAIGEYLLLDGSTVELPIRDLDANDFAGDGAVITALPSSVEDNVATFPVTQSGTATISLLNLIFFDRATGENRSASETVACDQAPVVTFPGVSGYNIRVFNSA